MHVDKITKDDKTIALGNVEFELYLVGNGTTDEKLLVGTYYTDVNGEILINDINTRKLYVEGNCNKQMVLFGK